MTIDLSGYRLIGPGSGLNDGISMNGRTNVEIKNGTIMEFGERGVIESNNTGKGHRVINVRVKSNGDYGIRLDGSGHLIKGCTSSEHALMGINANKGSTVTGNIAYKNAGDGIVASYGSTVIGNSICSGNDVDSNQGLSDRHSYVWQTPTII